MSKFMYLFRSNPAVYQNLGPEQFKDQTRLWETWLDRLGKTHIHQMGERLSFEGKVVKGKEEFITDGPYVEVKDMIQGYLLVSADDLDQAAELAKGCPVLAFGGSVEVRPFFEG